MRSFKISVQSTRPFICSSAQVIPLECSNSFQANFYKTISAKRTRRTAKSRIVQFKHSLSVFAACGIMPALAVISGALPLTVPRRRSLEGEIDRHSVRLGGRHMMFHGKFDQFGITVYPERLHNAVFVKGDSAGRQSQNVSYFFH
jgi:hypothetical protein